jgi:hypothetical protein
VAGPPPTPEVASSSGGGAGPLIDRAPTIATWLKKVVEDLKLYTVIQGKKHVQYEGWKMLAEKLGLDVYITDVRRVEYGDTWGFEYAGKLMEKGPDGTTVITGTSAIYNDERKWAGGALFAMRSMGETRTAGKLIRLHAGWIMKLAGYSPTPAEELADALENSPEASAADDVRLGLLADIRKLMEGDRTHRPTWLEKEIKTKKLRGQGYIWKDALGDPANERTQVVRKYINGCMFMLNDKSEGEGWDIGDFSEKSQWPLWALPMKFVHIIVGWEEYERATEDTA